MKEDHSLNTIYIRIGNLYYLRDVIDKIYKKYIPSGKSKEILLSTVLDSAIERTAKFLAARLVNVDLGSLLFSELYDTSKPTKDSIRHRAEYMEKYIAEIKKCVPNDCFSLILDFIEQSFCEGNIVSSIRLLHLHSVIFQFK